MSEAANTEGQASGPGFGEKIKTGIESYKRKRLMDSDKPTRPTNIPGTENPRGLVERFERGEIFRAFVGFRDEITKARQGGQDTAEIQRRLDDFKAKAKVYEGKLDTLNEQFYNNHTTVHIEDPELGNLNEYVVTLDINLPKEGEKDERVPYLVVPTYAANAHQVANFAMSLALEGQAKVHVISLPENRAVTDTGEEVDDWLSRVKKEGSFRLHAKLGKKVIEGMGLDKVNLVGTSMGAPIVVEMATDPELADKINDLIVVEPPGVVEKSSAKLLAQFLVGEGRNVVRDRGAPIKVMGPSEKPELVKMQPRDAKVAMVLAPILASRQVTEEKLRRVSPKGKFQVWVGTESYITGDQALTALVRAEVDREKEGLTPMQIINFEGGHNVPLSRFGVGAIISGERSQKSVVHISSKDLDHSLAESILRGQTAPVPATS